MATSRPPPLPYLRVSKVCLMQPGLAHKAQVERHKVGASGCGVRSSVWPLDGGYVKKAMIRIYIVADHQQV